MNPKQYLLWGGIVMMILGILGLVGIFGLTAEDSVFGASWFFGSYESWGFLIVGVIALVVALAVPAAQKALALIIGVVAILGAIYSFFGSSMELQKVGDTILHLVLGIWGIWAGLSKNGGFVAPAAAAPVAEPASPAAPAMPASEPAPAQPAQQPAEAAPESAPA